MTWNDINTLIAALAALVTALAKLVGAIRRPP
jgi:hypothetical protein